MNFTLGHMLVIATLMAGCAGGQVEQQPQAPTQQQSSEQYQMNRLTVLFHKVEAASGMDLDLQWAAEGRSAYSIREYKLIALEPAFFNMYTDEEAVLIIAHEAGHITASNKAVEDSQGSKACEFDADLQGAKLMLVMHYTVPQIEEAARLFLGARFANESESHPLGGDRYQRIVDKI